MPGFEIDAPIGNNKEVRRKTAVGKPDQKRSRFSNLPYELLEQIAYCINSGKDLFRWIKACKDSANLGDLRLLR
jgi:hypothetical protein